MNARRRKKAFNKLMHYKPLTKNETLCAIDYAVEHFGSLSKPMLIRDMARSEAINRSMKPMFDKVFYSWAKSENIKIEKMGFVTWL